MAKNDKLVVVVVLDCLQFQTIVYSIIINLPLTSKQPKYINLFCISKLQFIFSPKRPYQFAEMSLNFCETSYFSVTY